MSMLTLKHPETRVDIQGQEQIQFHIRRRPSKKIISAGVVKRPVKFVSGIGIASSEDLSPEEAKN